MDHTLYHLCVLSAVATKLSYERRSLPESVLRDLRLCARFDDARHFNVTVGASSLDRGDRPRRTFCAMIACGEERWDAELMTWAEDFFGLGRVYPDLLEYDVPFPPHLNLYFRWCLAHRRLPELLRLSATSYHSHQGCCGHHRLLSPLRLFLRSCGILPNDGSRADVSVDVDTAVARAMWSAWSTAFAQWDCQHWASIAPTDPLVRALTDYRDNFHATDTVLHDAVLAVRAMIDFDRHDDRGDLHFKTYWDFDVEHD